MPVASGFDVEKIRADFPCLHQEVHGHPLVFLDSAASAQKPKQVIEAQADVLRHSYANIHRGVYTLSERATDLHDGAREKVQKFLHAESKREIIFTRNVTEAINLIAQSFVRPNAKEGDEILITGMEHHANIVPWQLLAEQCGTKLVVAPITDEGELILEDFDRLITPRTRLVAATWVANALGTINPIETMIEMAHVKGVPIFVDAAQAVQHMPVDVQALDCDFLGFTSHKLYGPSGIGVLYGKAGHLEAMPPYQGGGDMILSVSYDKTEFNDIPYKFEAGTVAIEAAVGLGAAIDYVDAIGLAEISAHEEALLAYATRAIQQVPGLRLVGTARHKAAVLSFVMDDAHPHDIGTLLDLDGVAIRTGHHCAQPVLERLGHGATARASIGMYNTEADIDALVKSLHRVASMFS
ncbi:MAG: SufS family cysteine desulfurase [Geminicoccaceae bacterium]